MKWLIGTAIEFIRLVREQLFRDVDSLPLQAAGAQAPSFSVRNQNGELITLDAHPGKTLVLWWYPKASTPG